MTHPSDMAVLVERLRNAHDVYDSLRIYVAQGSLADLECDQSQEAIKAAIDALSTDQRTGQEVALAKAIDGRLWKVSGSKKPADLISALYDIEALVKVALTKAAHPVEADLREALQKLTHENGPIVIDQYGEGLAWRPIDYGSWTPLQQSRSTPGEAPHEVTDAEVRAHHRYRTLHEDFVTVETDLRNCAILIGHHYNSLRPVADKLKEALAASPVPVDAGGAELPQIVRDVLYVARPDSGQCGMTLEGEEVEELAAYITAAAGEKRDAD